MNVPAAITNMLLIITLSSGVGARAEEAVGGNNEPATQQTDSTTPESDSTSSPKPEPKPEEGKAEPGCSE